MVSTRKDHPAVLVGPPVMSDRRPDNSSIKHSHAKSVHWLIAESATSGGRFVHGKLELAPSSGLTRLHRVKPFACLFDYNNVVLLRIVHVHLKQLNKFESMIIRLISICFELITCGYIDNYNCICWPHTSCVKSFHAVILVCLNAWRHRTAWLNPRQALNKFRWLLDACRSKNDR